MKRILKKTLLFINLILAGLLVLSALSELVSPVVFWPFAFLGLIYPFLLIATVLFILFWMIFSIKYTLISILAILLTWGQLHRFVQFDLSSGNEADQKNNIRILSYNVRLFNYYQWLNDQSVSNQIIHFLADEKAGIICLQEFLAVKNTDISMTSLKKRMEGTPYCHVNFSNEDADNKGYGLATFSRFPIVRKGVIQFGRSPNGVIFSDIQINRDTIRVYNCHLQSTRLKKDDYNLLDSILFNYNDKHLNSFKQLTFRLKDAYRQRSVQADTLAAHIKTCRYPVIVCGDFNDTPVSYTYHKIRNSINLKDAYIESGKGFGETYFGNFPHFRIDYILHDRRIQTTGFTIKKVKYSDHFPIGCGITGNP